MPSRNLAFRGFGDFHSLRSNEVSSVLVYKNRDVISETFSVASLPTTSTVLNDPETTTTYPPKRAHRIHPLLSIAYAWKEGLVILLRGDIEEWYGTVPAIIPEDILALVRLDPPGSELCRISNMKMGATSSSESSLRMKILCTLLLPRCATAT
ncbi:hypothetical protein BJV78DRAFT_540297 [Lactifluus subvellereus]|nr:hypothetical protein BJV78DRAFT_540297 [Lactifluus subvellereus]